jgi:site-specific DNA-methyltransferase (adenine-specific)
MPTINKFKNKITLGDVVEKIKLIDDESVDIIIADPPYNIGKDFGNNFDTWTMPEYVLWCDTWIAECKRVLKPTGSLFIYGFSEILAHISVRMDMPQRWLIWHYTNKNVPTLNSWQRSHEALIYAWKENPIFNRDKVREPYTEGFLNGAAGKSRKGTVGRFSKNGLETVYNAHEGGALPRDVIKIPALAGGAGKSERWFICETCDLVLEPTKLKDHAEHETMKHPTQKPLELGRKLIASAAPPSNGMVLVPFAGTGSECCAAKLEGLDFMGFELNEKYIRLANGYLASVQHEPKLF